MLHILRVETKKEPFDTPVEKYCFKCRKRKKHQWFIHYPQGETGSYYEPHAAIECETCGRDYTDFGSA